MERLRDAFGEMGFSNVSTFIASGNVLFDTAARSAEKLEQRIEAELRAALGFDVATFLRTPAELTAIAATDVFPDDAGAIYVAFLKNEPDAERRAMLEAMSTDADRLEVRGREAWWLSVGGMGRSSFSGATLEKVLGTPATARNITTVRKLAAL
jgi:uncharacterized protein (DUF1697 family)